MARRDTRQAERALLHAGSPLTGWGNLGWWPAGDRPAVSYPQANEALARLVGQAARLKRGARVLSIACGAGEEIVLWIEGFGAASVLGLEHDAALVQIARQRVAGLAASSRQRPAVEVRQSSAEVPEMLAARDAAPDKAAFDAVVCIDAAYHLSPRGAWLEAMFARLAPGGRIAFTDLVVETPADASSLVLRHAARWAGIDLDEVLTLDDAARRLAAAGFGQSACQRLDDAVLGGFARFVARQRRAIGRRRWHPGWWRVEATARLIPAARRAGLGYALFSAVKPIDGVVRPGDAARRPSRDAD